MRPDVVDVQSGRMTDDCMQRDAAPRPAVRVGVAVIVRDGRVLIDRRAGGGPMADWWEFPGGKATPGESIPDCIRREIREELGVEVAVGDHLRTIVHEYPHARVELCFHLCTLTAGEPRAIEVAEIAWVTPQQTEGYRFLAANTPVLEDLADRFGRLGCQNHSLR